MVVVKSKKKNFFEYWFGNDTNVVRACGFHMDFEIRIFM